MFTENKRFTIKTFIFKQPYNNFTSQLQRDAEQFHDKVVQNLTGEALTLFNQIWVSYPNKLNLNKLEKYSNVIFHYFKNLIVKFPQPPPPNFLISRVFVKMIL